MLRDVCLQVESASMILIPYGGMLAADGSDGVSNGQVGGGGSGGSLLLISNVIQGMPCFCFCEGVWGLICQPCGVAGSGWISCTGGNAGVFQASA